MQFGRTYRRNIPCSRRFSGGVIEQSQNPAGYATTFNRANDQFSFEVSLHYATTTVGEIIEQCGLKDKVELTLLPEYLRLTPDYDLTFPQKDPQGIARILTEKLPHEGEGIRTFMEFLSNLLREYRTPMDPKTASSPTRSRGAYGSNRRHSYSTDILRTPKIKTILWTFAVGLGLPPSRLAAWPYTLATAAYMMTGRYYVKPRSKDLNLALMQTIENHGGQVTLKTEVEHILTKDGSVSGVRTKDGKTYTAKAVISNASAPATLEKMLQPGILSEHYMAKIRTYRPSISSFVVWLGLNK